MSRQTTESAPAGAAQLLRAAPYFLVADFGQAQG